MIVFKNRTRKVLEMEKNTIKVRETYQTMWEPIDFDLSHVHICTFFMFIADVGDLAELHPALAIYGSNSGAQSRPWHTERQNNRGQVVMYKLLKLKYVRGTSDRVKPRFTCSFGDVEISATK